MENLENYGVQNINVTSAKTIDGGSWLGEVIGKFVGAMGRYSGPQGALQFTIDYGMSKVQ